MSLVLEKRRDYTDETEMYHKARDSITEFNDKKQCDVKSDFDVPIESVFVIDPEIEERIELVSSKSMVLIFSKAFNPMTLYHFKFLEFLISKIHQQSDFVINFALMNIILGC